MQNISLFLKILALFTAYFVTARIGLSFEPVSGFATLIWPPTGIALASLLIFGFRLWPGIALGAFLVNFLTGASVGVALGMSFGNTLEAIVGAYLVKKVAGANYQLDRLQDVIALILRAAIFSTIISALIGTTSLLIGGVINFSAYYQTLFAWWIGDMLGNLVAAPLILVWSSIKISFKLSRMLEITVLYILLFIVSMIAFRGFFGINTDNLPNAYIVFPLLIWISLRFQQRASAAAIFLVSVIAIWGTIEGYGTFARATTTESLFLLQGFIGITSITFLVLSSVIAERKRNEALKEGLIKNLF